jgi:hypothetical protein
MRDHHSRAIEKARVRLLSGNPDLLAIIVGGSIAKGIEREDSDVDLVVVLPDDQYSERLSQSRVTFLWRDVCDYEDGYVDGKFVSRSYIREAAERGSEPTRHSFTGTYPVYCVDPDIATWLPLIPVYPEDRHEEKIVAFLAQMQLNRWFFWDEGKRRGDRYLQLRAATEVVLFGCRLILAHNRLLFACQKRLIEQTSAAPRKPDGLEDKINRLLTDMTDDAKEDFCQAIEGLSDWGKPDLLSRFVQDTEMSWFNHVHAVSEW